MNQRPLEPHSSALPSALHPEILTCHLSVLRYTSTLFQKMQYPILKNSRLFSLCLRYCPRARRAMQKFWIPALGATWDYCNYECRVVEFRGSYQPGGHVFLLISRGYIPMFCQYNISSLIFQRQMRDEMSDEASGQI